MRIKSNIQNTNRDFYTDLNGFQVSRKCYLKYIFKLLKFRKLSYPTSFGICCVYLFVVRTL